MERRKPLRLKCSMCALSGVPEDSREASRNRPEETAAPSPGERTKRGLRCVVPLTDEPTAKHAQAGAQSRDMRDHARIGS
jgi:hypothetical protein